MSVTEGCTIDLGYDRLSWNDTLMLKYHCLHSGQSVKFDLYDKLLIAIGDINHDVFRDLRRQGI